MDILLRDPDRATQVIEFVVGLLDLVEQLQFGGLVLLLRGVRSSECGFTL